MSHETEHLRHDIEHRRERMSDTLDQLGDRLNPSRIKQQVKSNIREATVGRVENMARQAADRVNETRDGVLDKIRENPIPAAMIGIGLGWMLFGGRRSQSDHHLHDRQAADLTGYAGTGYIGDVSATTPRLQQDDAAGGMGASISEDGSDRVIDRVKGRAATVRDTAADIIGSGREHLSDVGGRASEHVSDVANRVSHVASDVAETTRYQAQRSADRLSRTLEDNPLAVGAVALAIGMAAGFAIPESEREREMMGPARERLMERAREAASDAKERVQEVTERVVDEVSNETRSSGDRSSTTRLDESGASGTML